MAPAGKTMDGSKPDNPPSAKATSKWRRMDRMLRDRLRSDSSDRAQPEVSSPPPPAPVTPAPRPPAASLRAPAESVGEPTSAVVAAAGQSLREPATPRGEPARPVRETRPRAAPTPAEVPRRAAGAAPARKVFAHARARQTQASPAENAAAESPRGRIAERAARIAASSRDASRESLEVQPGPGPRTVRTASGEVLEVPRGWAMLEPGDAALTRRVKSSGPSWTVQIRHKRRMMSIGVWADAERIERLREARAKERETVEYRQRLEAGRQRRAREQDAYVEDFEAAIVEHLAFARCHAALAERLARAVAAHATPVGSGTVARTKRLTLEERVVHAVTAWLRHQTTDYDRRRFKDKRERSNARKELAREGKQLLARYRAGVEFAAGTCVLTAALDRVEHPQSAAAVNPFRERRRRRAGGSGVVVDADAGADSEEV